MSPRILGLKVLDENMQSCNGGEMQWRLRKWVSVRGTISMCSKGLHLTYVPNKWKGSRVFIAETPKVFEAEDDKVVCRRLRLLRELSPAALKAYNEAEATAEKAYNKATATAWKAYNEATATALKAYAEAEATALRAYDGAEATALKAYNEATATAKKAYNEAKAPAEKAYNEAIQAVLAGMLEAPKQ